ncbi:K02A2.6-like [Cordylochernes scorpioides]|uniref:RNA-directed DNA polymerase n=1 Tax=Cordylochernes scorpioides TaxID=51811 RepID=A0ABY6LHS3_9ARAC|nr:K02A2.6-like [Cordylochernes scorpioides]
MDFVRPSELALHGNVAENWRMFKQRLMLYLEATEKATKPDKLKVAILLNFIGEEALEVFNTFHLKEDEAENFDLVINKFDDFCEPKKNVIFERFKFFSATQKDGESIDSFITELKGLSTSCEFESQKDSSIRDHIVYGIQDKALQERLLREPNLTLLKAIEMCKTDEISKQQIKIMQNNQNICQIRKYEKKHSPKQNQESEKEFKCQRCGKSHRAKNCPAWGKRCSKCKKMNHFSAFCKSSAIRSLNDETEETVWSIHEAKVVHTLEWKKSIIVNGKEICFKLDSRAEVNVLPYTFTRQMKGLEIFQTNRKLTSYTGHEIKIKGIATLNCKTKNKTEKAIEKLSLIKKCDAVQIQQNNSAKEILNRHKNIFEGIGRLPIEHKIRLNENTTPVIAPSRKIPFSIREKVKAELERMEKLDIIEKVEEPSKWTHPIVVVQKPSGDVRICMAPRELNTYIQRERYILPTAKTIFSELKGATDFSVFDASSAFWQVSLDKESTNLCPIATPFGRFRFKRLPYGLNSTSEVFQRCINNILSGLQGTACYMDDILIYGSTMEEHNRNLETVLRRLEENNVKLNTKKQQIAVDKVNFLGHIISRDGIAIQASRAEAIQKLKRPENKTEVQRFLGMVTYLGKFIPNLSDKTAPLRKLISNKSEENDCFEKLKDMVLNAPILTFFDPTKPITISSDASQYGIVFGCERFQYYIWGNDVIVETDHKPLLSIVKKPLEKLSPRLQRMVLRLMRFQISLKFTPGKNMFNGWPKYKTKVCDEAKPYWQFQDDIHVSDGIVYKGNCIMVVHSSHQGIAVSKEIARSAFYWPGMITQVENEEEKCRTCQEYSRKNPEESRIAHEIPEFPWEKIAVDFMEVSGTSSILVVDYHSKFVEIWKLSSKRETETIMQLKTIFRTHGISRTLVSDNGPPFNSTGFKNFAQKYEFKHQTSSPKYPRSNGQSGRDPNLALMEFNNTPKYDLPSPTQMLMGRSVRTLSTYSRQQLKPLFDTTKNYQKLRDHQQKYAGSPKRILRPLEVGYNIMLQEWHRKWVPATVTVKHETPRSYMDLGLSPIGQESLKHVVFGGHTSENVHQEYRVNLGHASGNFKMVAKLLDQQKICGNLPRLSRGPWLKELKARRIWVPDIGKDDMEIEILLGCDVLGSIFMMKSCVLSNGLNASQTRFGWTLMGECQQGSDVSLAHHVTTMTISESSITNLWNLDVLGIMDPIEVKQRDQRDALARRHFLKTVQHSVSGRYVSLPWTVEKAKIADNREVAMKRLEQTTKKLISLNLYEDYDDIFRGWLDDGIIEKVPAEQHDAEAFYLPHRPVVKLSSGTTPIRPVFDASSKVYRSPSLNDCLEKGPNLIEMIPNLMLRFRNGKFGVVADIKKAFLQIEVNERDRDYLRFLWYSQNGEKTEVFRHRRVVFGVNYSPFILGAVIEYHLSNVRPEHKPLAQRLQKSFYVDNLVTSVNSFEELQDLKLTATSIMYNARMELSRWEHSLDVASDTYPFERAEISKVLGIYWDKREDCLSCEIPVAIPPKITKRSILSCLDQIYDLIGFLNPILIKPKIILQKVWIKRDNQLGTFVANRVKEICRLSDPGNLRYVPSECNPADLPSRGCSLSRLIQSTWWEGPSWLKLSKEFWPSSKTKRKIADEHRNFQEKCELEYFCSEVKDKIICLICNNAISVPKLYNIKSHYEQHKSKYDTYEGLMRQEKLKEFKLGMKKQQLMLTKVSQESEAAVHASYVLSEMMLGNFRLLDSQRMAQMEEKIRTILVVSGMKKKEEADKIDLFMYLMGDRADDIFRTFKFEKEEEATKIDFVLKAFDSHFCVRKNIIYERAKFNSRIQEDREPVDELITSLYKLADSCEFEGLHEQLIRDRIVVGVREDKALSERIELTLEKAVKWFDSRKPFDSSKSTCSVPQQAKSSTRRNNHRNNNSSLRGRRRSQPKQDHDVQNAEVSPQEGQACRAEGQKCNLCSKTGHFANCCPDKQAKTAEVKAVSELDEEIGFLPVSAVEDSSNLDDDEGECRRRWTAEIQVTGNR